MEFFSTDFHFVQNKKNIPVKKYKEIPNVPSATLLASFISRKATSPLSMTLLLVTYYYRAYYLFSNILLDAIPSFSSADNNTKERLSFPVLMQLVVRTCSKNYPVISPE